MTKIKSSDIYDQYQVCPYCMNDVGIDQTSCCGESNAHFDEAVETNDGEVYLLSEVEVIHGF